MCVCVCVECEGMLGWAGWWDDARVAGQWQSVVKAVASCMHTTRHLSHLCPHIGWLASLALQLLPCNIDVSATAH